MRKPLEYHKKMYLFGIVSMLFAIASLLPSGAPVSHGSIQKLYRDIKIIHCLIWKSLILTLLLCHRVIKTSSKVKQVTQVRLSYLTSIPIYFALLLSLLGETSSDNLILSLGCWRDVDEDDLTLVYGSEWRQESSSNWGRPNRAGLPYFTSLLSLLFIVFLDNRLS